MTKSIANGRTDTAIAGNPAMTVTAGKLNFAADFLVTSNVPGEVILTNRTSPLNQLETIRISQKGIKDIYSGSDIDPSARVSTKSGIGTLIELRGTFKETDSVDATYEVLLPYKVGLQFNWPTYSSCTADMALTEILRALGAVFETGTVTSAGVNNILHGALKKADL